MMERESINIYTAKHFDASTERLKVQSSQSSLFGTLWCAHSSTNGAQGGTGKCSDHDGDLPLPLGQIADGSDTTDASTQRPANPECSTGLTPKLFAPQLCSLLVVGFVQELI